MLQKFGASPPGVDAKRKDNHMSNQGAITLSQGDERAYRALSQAASTAVDDLLLPFKAMTSADSLLEEVPADEFFKKFLVYADRFTDECCQKFAKILRQASILSEVRGTPTLALARQIREENFAKLDSTLVDYVQALRENNIDLGQTVNQLQESSLLGAAMRGAAIGQVAGGFGSSGRKLGVFNALMEVVTEAQRQTALRHQSLELLIRAKA